MSPPPPANSPRFTSNNPNHALSAATIRSHASAISNPPATAVPFTAAMIGFGKSRITIPPNPPRLVVNPRESPAATIFRSAPAEKTSPVPVSTTTRTDGVVLDVVERLLDAVRDGVVDRVLRFRPVDAQDLDVPAAFAHDAHRVPLAVAAFSRTLPSGAATIGGSVGGLAQCDDTEKREVRGWRRHARSARSR